MSERTSYQPGVPCWVDLSTSDPAGAQRFYADLFGWEVEDQGEQYGHYGIALLHGKTVAGIGPLPPGGQALPAWSTYLATDNLDETIATVKEAGGNVVMGPMDIGEAGRMAFAQDPAGALVGFWQALDHIGSQLVNEPGTFCWNELTVTDVAAADEFYGVLFEYEFEKLPESEDNDYVLLKIDGQVVGGRGRMAAEAPTQTPPHWLLYFAVADTDAIAAKVTSGGGTVISPPRDSPYGRMATCTDPAGAVFAIISMPEQS